MRITRSLGIRLFFLLLLVGTLIFLPATMFLIRVNSQHLMEQILASAKRMNNLIQGSVHYSMLQNQKEDVAEIIDTLGRQPGVEAIRIYNKKGIIAFSTDKAEIGQAVDVKAEQCTVCHKSERPLEYVPDSTRPRIFKSARGDRVLALVNPIPNEPACAKPTCHPPPAEQKILGVLDAKLSLAQVDKNIAESRSQMILYSIAAVVLIELFTGLFIWRMVHQRVKQLAEGTRQVMEGNLDFRLEVWGRDEISSLAWSFNRMIADLQRAWAENREWARTLEDKVEQKTKELKAAQEQMVHVAKMASMGKLAATVAHEINNPLGGILTYSKLLSRRLSSGTLSAAEQQTLVDQLEIVIGEIKRCGNIVRNMLHFTKGADYLFEETDLHAVIAKSLFIIAHHLEINGISLVKELKAADPRLVGNASQLQQALIALFINAVEAMSPGGTLTVRTEEVDEGPALRLRVEDTGRGIPREIQSQIFEPFFTTKEDTHGVGLGLSVVYGIVQGHQGQIEVQSEVGEGTAFIITLPRRPAARAADGEAKESSSPV